MKLENVLNYINTASPEQIDAMRKHLGEKKQAVLIKGEYERAMQELRDQQATEIGHAEARLVAMKERHAYELSEKLKYYQVSAASRGLHWDEVMSAVKKPRTSKPRKWKVVAPIAVDTRSFIHAKNAIAYRKRMGGYLVNIQSGKTYFNNGFTSTRNLPM